VKCPKCNYLGFETGDRCRNCGYDFSLLSMADGDAADYEIHPPAEDDVPVHVVDDLHGPDADPADPWFGEDRDDPFGGKAGIEPTSRDTIDVIDDSLTLSLTPESPLYDEDIDTNLGDVLDAAELSPLFPSSLSPAIDSLSPSSAVVPFPPSVATASSGDALPLFVPADHDDDEPLIKLPATPRPPLAVRRTPDTPRLRRVPTRRSFSEGGPRPLSYPSPAPVLQFAEEPAERILPVEEPDVATALGMFARGSISGQPSGAGAQLMAAAIDYAILLGIDLAVVYFTLRIAGLALSDWRLVPAAPMVTFLALLKLSYFYAFTVVGGQTIGKMALGTCVVATDGTPVDAGRAMRRTTAGILSFLLLGLGFVPAFFGGHRALHDRLAGTRVIRLRSV
jgi:uncharacterized RDD family membrane protein YckC